MWPLTSFGHALKARSGWFIGQIQHLWHDFVAAHAVQKGAQEVENKAKVVWFGRVLRSVNWQELGSLIIYTYLTVPLFPGFPCWNFQRCSKWFSIWECLTTQRLKSHPPGGHSSLCQAWNSMQWKALLNRCHFQLHSLMLYLDLWWCVAGPSSAKKTGDCVGVCWLYALRGSSGVDMQTAHDGVQSVTKDNVGTYFVLSFI